MRRKLILVTLDMYRIKEKTIKLPKTFMLVSSCVFFLFVFFAVVVVVVVFKNAKNSATWSLMVPI